jgi:cysteine desulfurase/selenocysteine lyase
MTTSSTSTAAPAVTFDVARVRGDFPALAQTIHGRPLVYLDSAATAQKPRAVLDAVAGFNERDCANVHRGVYQMAARATAAFEAARESVQRFVGAESSCEIVFTRGTTEAINLVAQSFARPRLRAGDAILITGLEHHSNIVPWQLVCEQTGASLRVAPIDGRGQVVVEEFERLLDERVQLAAFSHVSNALGTVNPVEEMVAMARARGVATLIDGAQAAPHRPFDVRALGCDFYAFSGHKVFGPTGIGALYGRAALLAAMPPYQGGGEMIRSVSFEKTTYAEPPHRFEAGTPNISGAIGLGAALGYVEALGRAAIEAHEAQLLARATEALSAIPGLTIWGTAEHKAAVVSFTLDGVHPHDVGTFLDGDGVAVRAGHHCAQPVMDHFGIPATTRASFGLYNTLEEVAVLAAAVRKVRDFFA